MKLLGLVKVVSVFALLVSVCPAAEARQALWDVEMDVRLRGSIWDDAVDSRPRVVARFFIDEKLAVEMDTTTGDYVDLTFPGDVVLRTPGAYLKESDRNSPLTAEQDDLGDTAALYAQFRAPQPFKKPTVDAPAIDLSQVVSKGKVKVNKSFQKVKWKGTYKVAGTVQGGEYDGHPVTLKLKLKAKGERDDE